MRRAVAVHAEVIRRGDNAAAEEMQPHAVRHDARGERVLRMCQPLSQFPPTALNRSFGEQSGRPSVNGEKLCPGLPSRMMLYLSRTCELYQPQVVSGLVDTS